MNPTQQAVADLLDVFLDPHTPQSKLDTLTQTAADLLEQIDGMAKNDLPKNRTATCLYLATQAADTDNQTLKYLLEKYHRSLEVAKLVARHPALSMYGLSRLSWFLPEHVKANPSHAQHTEDEKWAELIKQEPKTAGRKYSYFSRVFDFTVDEERPEYFKLNYWLKNGKAADINYLARLDKIEERVLLPFATYKSAHVRKSLASRATISAELAETLKSDKAKTVRQALAENPKCPAEVLASLTQDPEAVVKKAALANKACPDDAVHAARLAEQMQPKPKAKPLDQQNEQELVAQLAAQATPAEALEALAQMPQAFVRAGVALHPNTDPATLTRLANDAEPMVRLSVAYNPATPEHVLQALLDKQEPDLYAGLAANPALTEAQQLALIEVADEAALLSLANTTESTAVWEALRDSPEPKKSAKSGKKKTWRECLQICLDPKGKGLYALQRNRHTRHLFVHKLVARHPKCSDSLKGPYAFYLLESLMKNPALALAMLENPNAIKPEEFAEWKLKDWFMYEDAPGHVVRHYLYSDEIKFARKAVVCRFAQLVDVQARIHSDDIHMKKYMAGLPHSTRYMLEILARDPKESVRMAVVDNKHTPAEVLAHLAADKVAGIRTAAQSHKNFNASLAPKGTTTQIESLKNKGPKRIRIKQAKDTTSLTVLRDLAGDRVADVRKSVITNEQCPLDVLQLLMHDEVPEIRAISTSHPNSTLDINQQLLNDVDDQVRYRAFRNVCAQTAVKPKLKKGEHDNYRNRLYDADLLAQYKDDNNERIRAIVAGFTRDTDIQQQMAKDPSIQVQESLARNLFLDTSLALEMINNAEPRVVMDLAQNTRNEDIYLACLARGERIHRGLRRNYELLERLSVQQQLGQHKDARIRELAAGHTKDHALIEQLIKDPDISVAEALAYNQHLKVKHRQQLLEIANQSIVSNLNCYHDKYLKKHAEELASHPNKWVRSFVAGYHTLPAEQVAVLAADEAFEVRNQLVEGYTNELTEEQIEQLRNDPNETVRNNVKWRFD
jgi:hypothetical protein